VACGLGAWPSWPQEAPRLSIPIDPSQASLEIDPEHIRPDGSQFLLLVRVGGSAPLKYVASREDRVRWFQQQWNDLIAEGKALTERIGVLKQEGASLRQKVSELEASKTDLLQTLTAAKKTEVRLRQGVRADSETEPGSEPAEGESAPGGAGERTVATSTSVEAAIAEEDAESGARLLTLPIAPGEVELRINPERIRPDGSEFQLLVKTGGIELKYVASREDVVLDQNEQFGLQLKLVHRLREQVDTLEATNRLLEEKIAILGEDVEDLGRAVQLTQQNIQMLQAVLKAQKPSGWQRFIEVLPAIVGIISVAIASN